MGKELQFDKLDMTQGLSNNWVICFYKDSRGYLWIGTWDGLNKYDGNNFTNYIPNEADSNSIAGNMINALYEDKNNNLWVGTSANYISIYDRATERFLHFTPDNDGIDRKLETVYSFLEVNDSLLLIGTEHGLDMYNPKTKSIKRYTHDPKNPNTIAGNVIRDIVRAKNSNIWIATDKGLSKISDSRFVFRNYYHRSGEANSLPHNYINALHLDSRGQLWVGTNSGLSKYLPLQDAFQNFLTSTDTLFLNPSSYIRDIADNGQDILYISTDNGLAVLQNEETSYYLPDFDNNNSLSSNNITCLFADEYGTLWVGTYNGGVNYYNKIKNRFAHIKAGKNALQNPYVYSITQDTKGQIWVGTEQGLNIFDPKTKVFNAFRPTFKGNVLLKDKAILSIICDKAGDIWVGTHNAGLFYLPKGQQEFVNYRYRSGSAKEPSHNYIYRIHESRNQKIIIANQKELQYFNKKTREFESISTYLGKEINSGFVYNMYEEPSGNIWLSTNFGIRYIDFVNDTVLYIRRDDNQTNHLASNKTSCILGDSKGNIWIGLGGEGLNHLNTTTGKFTHYTDLNGLPHNNVSNIFEDESGNIWLSTGKGVAKFINGVNTPNPPDFRVYKPSENEDWYGFKESSLYISKTGMVYIGSHNGIYAFHPKTIIDNPYPPKLVFTNLEIYNKKVPVTQKGVLRKQLNETSEIVLSHRESIFTIEFAALNLIYPRNNYYSYKLEGVSDWVDLGTSRSITFSNLKYGRYTLLVRAANNHRVWNSNHRKIQITIRPPWYSTLLFRILFILFIVSISITLVRIRILNLRRQHEILGRLVDQRTKEINEQKEVLKFQAEVLKEQTLNLEAANADLQDKNMEVLSQKEHIVEMADKLHEADQQRLKFLTNISHELLTPLTIITSSLEKLIQSNASEGVRITYKNMLKNGNKLLQLIRQLLDFRQIDNGVMKLQAEEHDLIAFIDEIKNAFEPVAENSTITFTTDSKIRSLKTWFDPDKVDKILYNLLSNAFKYTLPGGKVQLQIVPGPLMIVPYTQTETKSVLVKVIDTGIGIKAENLEKIFDRFFKSDESREMQNKGTGIGLTFARELAQIHKAILTVQSEPGKGTEFCLQLPIGQTYLSPDEKIHSNRKAVPDFVKTMVDTNLVEDVEAPKKERPESAPVLLIIEDNKSIRSLIASELQDSFYVFEASDGLEGLVKAKEQIPDLIVSDIMMPKIDGIELCKKLKSEILTSHIPILLLTAKGADENKISGYQSGADDYITKPFSMAVLKARIENLIKSRQQLKEKYLKSTEADPEALFPENTLDRRFLEKIISIIENDLSNSELDNKQLTKEIGLGKSQLYAKIKALTGQSVHEFMRTIRLKKAAEILLKSSVSISEVAYMTGFNSLIYFSRSFKKQFGVTPSDYITQNRQTTSENHE